MVTLGISTNTRLLGIVIIKQGVLVDYFIRLHKSPWSPSKVTEIITSLEPCVRQYCIKSVVLSIPHVYHQTEAFKTLICRIREYFEKKQIAVYTHPPSAIYALCPPGQKKTKQTLMEALVASYPQLTYCYQKELRNKTKYYYKLFEAVAVAMVHEERQ